MNECDNKAGQALKQTHEIAEGKILLLYIRNKDIEPFRGAGMAQW